VKIVDVGTVITFVLCFYFFGTIMSMWHKRWWWLCGDYGNGKGEWI